MIDCEFDTLILSLVLIWIFYVFNFNLQLSKILDYNDITNYTYIRFSDKSQEDICHGIQEFCHVFHCEKNQLCFYEDDKNVISLLKSHNVQVVEVLA